MNVSKVSTRALWEESMLLAVHYLEEKIMI